MSDILEAQTALLRGCHHFLNVADELLRLGPRRIHVLHRKTPLQVRLGIVCNQVRPIQTCDLQDVAHHHVLQHGRYPLHGDAPDQRNMVRIECTADTLHRLPVNQIFQQRCQHCKLPQAEPLLPERLFEKAFHSFRHLVLEDRNWRCRDRACVRHDARRVQLLQALYEPAPLLNENSMKGVAGCSRSQAVSRAGFGKSLQNRPEHRLQRQGAALHSGGALGAKLLREVLNEASCGSRSQQICKNNTHGVGKA
mmetsp:Transcript_96688/g.134174  ORF Transcript_96688/g.134174 Transcript_96688/m.134174 type:complete len:252 (-) Transcript_96688:32-787(-)